MQAIFNTLYFLLKSMFDRNKKSKVLKDIILPNGNWHQKNEVLVPGAIPLEYWNEKYLVNVEDPIIDRTIAGETGEPPLTLTMETHKVSKPVDYDKININTATLEQITSVEGIGNQNANRFIKERDEKGKYESIDNLVDRLPGLTKFKAVLEERFSF